MSEINTDRFYLCDNGDSEDAFLVCGECAKERNPELYTELPLLPDVVGDKVKRVCIKCEQTERELQ